MANRLVSVDENFRLPPEVQAQLSQDVEDDLQGLVDTATTAADTASAAATSVATDASTATGAAGAAEESAATAQETADIITDLLDDWTIDTSDAGVNTLIENPESQTRQTLDDLYEFNAGNITEALDNVPTFEEQSITVPLAFGDVTSTAYIPIYTALFPARLQQAALVTAASVYTDPTSYWNIRFLRYRDGWATLVGEKRTIPVSSGGQAISAYNAWDYDMTALSNTDLLKGDVLVIHLSRSGTPTPLVRPTVTFRINAADDVQLPETTDVVYDDFNRANASSLGTATSGQVWTTSTNWTIASKTATKTSGTSRALMDTGTANCTIKMRLISAENPTTAGSVGITFRYSDTDGLNGWGITHNALFKSVAGTVTYISAQEFAPVTSGDTVKVILNGSKIRVLVDRGSTGVYEQVVDLTDAFNSTATLHGMRGSGTGLHKADLWQVTV